MRISDWSSDVCSSDLPALVRDDLREASRAHAGVQHEAIAVIRLRPPGRGLERARRLAAAALGVELHAAEPVPLPAISAERRVGSECVSTVRSRWSPSHYTKNSATIKECQKMNT